MSKIVLGSSSFISKLPADVFFEKVRPYLTLGDQQSFMCSHSTGLSKPELLKARIEERGWATEKNLKDYFRLSGQVLRSDKVHMLDLTGSSLDDEGLERVADCFPELKKAVLARCQKITGKGLAALGKKCQKLKELDCTGCLKVRDCGGEAGVLFPKLEVLILSYVLGITDEGLKEFLARCPILQELRIAGNPHLRGIGVFNLCPGLQRLDVSSSGWLTDAMLQEIRQQCPALKWVRLIGSEGVTQVGLALLQRVVVDAPALGPVAEVPAPRPTLLQKIAYWIIGLILGR